MKKEFEIYEKAKKDLENYKKQSNNVFKITLLFLIWSGGLYIISLVSIDFINNFISKNLPSILVGPIKSLSSFFVFIIIFLLYTFIIALIYKLSRQPFRKELQKILDDFVEQGGKKPEKFYNDLLNMKNKSKKLSEIMAFYINLSYALAYMGNFAEVVILSDLLEENSYSSELTDSIINLKKHNRSLLMNKLISTLKEVSNKLQ